MNFMALNPEEIAVMTYPSAVNGEPTELHITRAEQRALRNDHKRDSYLFAKSTDRNIDWSSLTRDETSDFPSQ